MYLKHADIDGKLFKHYAKAVEGYLFTDEISMVPYEMLCMIDSRLRQFKNKDDETFGGLSIMLFGVLMQLPPIKGAQVFDQPVRFLPAQHLWCYFTLVEVTENMRHQSDTCFADLLNGLRIGELKGSTWTCCCQRL